MNTTTRPLFVVVALWFALALAAACAGVISVERPPFAIPILIWGLVIGFFLARARSPALQRAIADLDLRIPISFHVLRVGYGAAFLLLAARGELNESFAALAGPGDIAAGLGAVLAATLVRAPRFRKLVLAWNALALLDILLVFFTAQRILLFGDRASMAAFGTPAFAILPLFVVPMILITHGIVFVRLLKPTPQTA